MSEIRTSIFPNVVDVDLEVPESDWPITVTFSHTATRQWENEPYGVVVGYLSQELAQSLYDQLGTMLQELDRRAHSVRDAIEQQAPELLKPRVSGRNWV